MHHLHGSSSSKLQQQQWQPPGGGATEETEDADMPEAEAASGGNKRKAEEMCDLADDLELFAELLAAVRAGSDDTTNMRTVAKLLARHGAKRRKAAGPRG